MYRMIDPSTVATAVVMEQDGFGIMICSFKTLADTSIDVSFAYHEFMFRIHCRWSTSRVTTWHMVYIYLCLRLHVNPLRE